MSQPLLVFKTLWGVAELDDPLLWPSTFRRIKADGFDGIEHVATGPFFAFAKDPDTFKRLLSENGLKYIAQAHTCGYPVPNGTTVADHLASLRTQVQAAVQFNPVLVNSHSGKDSFTLEEALEFFNGALAIEKEFNIPILHESHRQRILYSPFVMRDLVKSGRLSPDVKINADLSHWAVVCERCMDDTNDADFWHPILEDLATRCDLIHGRVGWAQAPQVNDPFAPEHADAVASHERWWSVLVRGMVKRGKQVLIEPEFGPYPYLPALPYTKQPVADLWEINTKYGKKLRTVLGQVAASSS